MANEFEVSSKFQFTNHHPGWSSLSAAPALGSSPPGYMNLITSSLPALQQTLWSASEPNSSAPGCRSTVWRNDSRSVTAPHWNSSDDRVVSHQHASSPSLGMPPPQNGFSETALASDLLAAMLHAHSLSSTLSFNQSIRATNPDADSKSIPSQQHQHNSVKWPASRPVQGSQLPQNAADDALSILTAISNTHGQQISLPMPAPTSGPVSVAHVPHSAADTLLPPSSSPSWFNLLSTSNPLTSLPAHTAELALQHQQLAINLSQLPSSSSAHAASLLASSPSLMEGSSKAMSQASSDTLLDGSFASSPSCSPPPVASPCCGTASVLSPHQLQFHPGMLQLHSSAGVNIARSDASDASTDTVIGGSSGGEEFSEEEVTAAAWERSRTLAVLGIKYDGVVSAELRRSVGAPFQHLKGFVGVYMPAMSLRSCKTNRRSRSFAFIKFSTPDAAAAALDTILATSPDATVALRLPGAGGRPAHCQVERVQEKSTADLVQKYRSFVKSCQRLGLYHLLS